MRSLLCLSFFLLPTSLIHGNPYLYPITGMPAPIAPSPYNTVPYYCSNPYGMVYGPNYYLVPPSPPPMLRPHLQGGACGPGGMTVPSAGGYHYHPWVRGPRDFFMFRENLQDEMERLRRPNLVP